MPKFFAWPFSALARRFRRDDTGNVAVIFALTMVPIIAFVGAAVDFSHANAVKSAMQDALDSTALMLARYAPTHNSDEIQEEGARYFRALFNEAATQNISIQASYSTEGGTKVVVNGSMQVPTDFMEILGYDYVTVTGSSTTKWGSTRLRVALVLDNTGSMADDGKMAALKKATKNLLTQLQSAASNPGDVYVSIIPFSKDVNVGAVNYAADWIDWSDWEDDNGHWEATQSCDRSRGHSRRGRSHCDNNYTWEANNHNTWNGCVTDRGGPSAPGSTAGYDQKVDAPDPSNADTLFPAEQDSSCPVEMMGQNYDWSAMNRLVESMQSNGSTNQPIGLVWGWQSLVGGGPLSAPSIDTNYHYQKIIVLLSDGLNTQDRWYGNGSNTSTAVDNRMYQTGNGSGTCANIKAAGVTIYTIQVNTGGDPKSTLLQNCASSTDKFYLLTSANSIVGAFNSIGTELTKLRVAK